MLSNFVDHPTNHAAQLQGLRGEEERAEVQRYTGELQPEELASMAEDSSTDKGETRSTAPRSQGEAHAREEGRRSVEEDREEMPQKAPTAPERPRRDRWAG